MKKKGIYTPDSIKDKIINLCTGENKLERCWLVFRRFYYLNFNKKYVEESLKKRKGKCNKKGCCCMITHCKYFDKRTKLCSIWLKEGKDALPLTCKQYPFDEKDKMPEVKKNCGFYWEND